MYEIRTLSFGQRMRADLGAALLHNPKVLYLDKESKTVTVTFDKHKVQVPQIMNAVMEV